MIGEGRSNLNDSACEIYANSFEGTFNRVFRLGLDTGDDIVARIPFRNAGPRSLLTRSEVSSSPSIAVQGETHPGTFHDESLHECTSIQKSKISLECTSGSARNMLNTDNKTASNIQRSRFLAVTY